MVAVDPELKVTKQTGEIVAPTALVVGDAIRFEGESETSYHVDYIDGDVVLFSHGDEQGLITLSQPYLDALTRPLPDQPVDDENEDSIDRSGTEDDTEGAALSFDIGKAYRIVRAAGRAVAELPGAAAEAAKNRGKTVVRYIPGRFNPFTGNGVLTHVYKTLPANWDITGNGHKLSGLGDLREGDILLKQMQVEPKHWDSSLITGAQIVLSDSSHPFICASLLTHALIYIGNGKVIEAVKQGVGVTPLDRHSAFNDANYKDYTFYIVRSKHSDVIQEALKAAKALVGTTDVFSANTPVKVKYNNQELYFGIGLRAGQIFGSKFVSETVAIIASGGDATHQFAKKLKEGRDPQLFCSELVAYSYHTAADNTRRTRFFKQAQQDRISPEELYVQARLDDANFTYVGKLPAGVR